VPCQIFTQFIHIEHIYAFCQTMPSSNDSFSCLYVADKFYRTHTLYVLVHVDRK